MKNHLPRKFFCKYIRFFSFLAIICFFTLNSNAATYTTYTSGSWGSVDTWGDTPPSYYNPPKDTEIFIHHDVNLDFPLSVFNKGFSLWITNGATLIIKESVFVKSQTTFVIEDGGTLMIGNPVADSCDDIINPNLPKFQME